MVSHGRPVTNAVTLLFKKLLHTYLQMDTFRGYSFHISFQDWITDRYGVLHPLKKDIGGCEDSKL